MVSKRQGQHSAVRVKDSLTSYSLDTIHNPREENDRVERSQQERIQRAGTQVLDLASLNCRSEWKKRVRKKNAPGEC